MPEDRMQSPLSKNRVFRFAPSPNGLLHLGHALSAILNRDMAAACGGRFLLRIEDIDPARSRPEFEAAIYRDLAWLGLDWERPVRRQSEHLAFYGEALHALPGLIAITWGARGAGLYRAGQQIAAAAPPPVIAIDTTGAGDAFVGALTLALLEGQAPEAALKFACTAGALAATRAGAQPSLPTRAEVDARLESA